MKIRTLIVDDHMVIRRGLVQALALQNRVEVVAEASSGAEALAQVDQHKPGLVLMDVHLPDANGIDLSRQILAKHADVKIIILTSDSARPLVDEALGIGVGGYLSKSDPAEELLQAIESVMDGKVYVSARVSGGILADYQERLQGKPGSETLKLTMRERQLLRLVAEGRRNKEISVALDLSLKSIEAYRSRLMKKLNCTSPAELIRYAVREGIAEL